MKSLSFRIPGDLAERVAARTRRWPAKSDSETYRQIIEEWVRVQDHPGIRFVDGPAGRRAALVGGPDIWQMIAIVRDFESDREAILDAYPWLTVEMLDVVQRYFEAYPEEIEALIEDNLRVAEELEREVDLVVRERSAIEDATNGESEGS